MPLQFLQCVILDAQLSQKWRSCTFNFSWRFGGRSKLNNPVVSRDYRVHVSWTPSEEGLSELGSLHYLAQGYALPPSGHPRPDPPYLCPAECRWNPFVLSSVLVTFGGVLFSFSPLGLQREYMQAGQSQYIAQCAVCSFLHFLTHSLDPLPFLISLFFLEFAAANRVKVRASLSSPLVTWSWGSHCCPCPMGDLFSNWKVRTPVFK